MAKGSQTTRGDYPATCSGCGKPVRVTVDSGELKSWHPPCRRLALVGRTVG